MTAHHTAAAAGLLVAAANYADEHTRVDAIDVWTKHMTRDELRGVVDMLATVVQLLVAEVSPATVERLVTALWDHDPK